MEVPRFVDGYPKPEPAKTKKMDIFRREDYALVDTKAAKAPAKLVDDYGQLMDYLTAGLGSDLAKVRAIFAWLSTQDVVQTQFPKAVKEDTPQAFLKRIKYDRSLYSDFFAVLCRKAGVPCVIIEGSSKGAGYELGQRELKVTNRWNAVHVQGAWRLVNVPWALVKVDGLQKSKTWMMVEVGGEAVREWEEAKGEVLADMDEFWFLTDPEDFNCFLHATERRWQLLQDPWSPDQYHDMPKFAQDYFQSQWELVSDYRSVLTAEKGKCQIQFVHPQNVTSAGLDYNLYFCPALSKKQLPNDLQLDRYVLEDSKLGEKALLTRLPVEGVYKIEVAGHIDDQLTVLAEFRIDCVNLKQPPPPFPISNTPIGPTEVAREVLSDFSHENGVVVAKAGERVDMKFQFQKKRERRLKFLPNLIHNNMPKQELEKCLKCVPTKDDVNISVTLPKTKNVNEFALSIDVIEIDETGQEEQKHHLQLINYLITADGDLKFLQQQESIQAKNDLMVSMKDINIDRLHKTMADAEAKGVLDPLTRAKVNKYLLQLNKIRGEKLKVLLEAMKGSDVGGLEAALEDYEKYGSVDRPTITQARAVLELLRALKDDDDVTRLDDALHLVQKLKVDATTHVQRASNRLVFHHEKDLADKCSRRSLAELTAALHSADKCSVGDRLKEKPAYQLAQTLTVHLKEVSRVNREVGNLTARDMKPLTDKRGKAPHPHVHSVMMATFILLGEREQDLWEWEVIQNLLTRRNVTGVMAQIDIGRATKKQVELAENHVRQCQLEVMKAESGNSAALFLQWVVLTVEEFRGREEAKSRPVEILNPEMTSFKRPSHWEDQPETQAVHRVTLQQNWDEYRHVLDNFTRTLGNSSAISVTKIERIQNPLLYSQYVAKKEHMARQNPGLDNEKRLWHGTWLNAIDSINMYGFNRSYCGRNATAYGAGVYFAVNSSYSASETYSKPDTSGSRYMYQCLVLTGHAMKGSSDLKVLKSRQGPVTFDSATDQAQSPTMFVIFNDTQAYPEYLLTFQG